MNLDIFFNHYKEETLLPTGEVILDMKKTLNSILNDEAQALSMLKEIYPEINQDSITSIKTQKVKECFRNINKYTTDFFEENHSLLLANIKQANDSFLLLHITEKTLQEKITLFLDENPNKFNERFTLIVKNLDSKHNNIMDYLSTTYVDKFPNLLNSEYKEPLLDILFSEYYQHTFPIVKSFVYQDLISIDYTNKKRNIINQFSKTIYDQDFFNEIVKKSKKINIEDARPGCFEKASFDLLLNIYKENKLSVEELTEELNKYESFVKEERSGLYFLIADFEDKNHGFINTVKSWIADKEQNILLTAFTNNQDKSPKVNKKRI